VRNTKAFKQAVADTLEHLARLGVSGVAPTAIADQIEQNITAASRQLGIQPASAWRYFEAESFAQAIAAREREERAQLGDGPFVGQAPYPEVGNPEMAVLIAGFPDALAECGGDLHHAIINVIVNAWMAGHIEGEDACAGCDTRGPGGHDYAQRMASLRQMVPDFAKWFDAAAFNARLAEAGYEIRKRADALPS